MSASMVEVQSPPDAAEAVARALLDARRAGAPAADAQALPQQLQSPEEAYRAQQLVARELEPGAGVATHWKSGGPSRTAVLTHAALPEQGVWASGADAGRHPFRLRVVEAEVALRLGEAVGPARAAALTPEQAAGLVDAICVSIELVDSRWQQGLEAPALLKLADLQSHGALVLGEWQPFRPHDWAAQACTVRIGPGQQVFRGTHSLQDPTWLLPTWLRHATRHGATVRKGAVVTTGTWCGMLPAARGDLVQVAFDGIGQAQVQL